MNKAILLATIFVELVLMTCGFVSMHLRASAERRRITKLPSWQLVPWSFKIDYFQDSNVKGIKPPKIMKPRSGSI